MRRWIARLGFGLAVLALAGCQPAAPRPTVMVYSPFPKTVCADWAAAFEQDTGIHVEQIEESTTRVYSRLRAEKAYPRCDVWVGGGGMVPFISAAREGLLDSYEPHTPFPIPLRRGHLILRDPHWLWEGVAIIGLGFAYNPQLTPVTDLPRTWDDLALPQWKNEVIMYDPAASGTAMLFLEAALLRSLHHTGTEEQGWRFLQGFYDNLERYAGDGPPSLMVSRGECRIGIHFEHQMLQYIEQNPDPAAIAMAQRSLRWTILPESPVIVDPIALIHDAPHPENGKKFIDWVYSHRGMSIANQFFFVVDPSFPPPPHLDYTLDELLAHDMPVDVEWMGDNFHRILNTWQNRVEVSQWVWQGL